MTTRRQRTASHGFSLIEVLLVLAIISIMAALVINAFSNAAQDSRNVISRQQQAALQSAINNWASAQIGRKITVDDGTGTGTLVDLDGDSVPDVFEMTVSRVRDKYNFSTWWTAVPSGAHDAVQRLGLVVDYLDEDTYQHFVDNSPAGDTSKLMTNAMKKTSQYLQLPVWANPSAGNTNPYPKVDLYP